MTKNRLHRLSCMLLIISLMMLPGIIYSQQTVFGLLKKDIALGDKYYENLNYPEALKQYLKASEKTPNHDVQIRIARCYVKLKEYKAAIDQYTQHLDESQSLPDTDLYNLAELHAMMGNYDKAIQFYRTYLESNPNSEYVMAKIWRLSNIQYLFEDSTHFQVQPVSFNSGFGELCPVLYKDKLLFISNRERPQIVEKVNASNSEPFYTTYTTDIYTDTSNSITGFGYGNVSLFNSPSPLNSGPVVFFNNYQQMAFVKSARDANMEGGRKLKLHFAKKERGSWDESVPFIFNSNEYSIFNMSINEEGNTLYFTSDMEGGLGGTDIYISTFQNGAWTEPINLGSTINTPYDENSPFLFQGNTLFFSSNGHPGMGGTDIFYSTVLNDGFTEPQNIGYPMNSSFDDFSLVTDSTGEKGYLASNRTNGGFDDDIYEFKMDLQTYPVTIRGVIKYKEHHLDTLSEAQTLANTTYFLIDKNQKSTLFEGKTDEKGNFSLIVPYFSNYFVRVPGENGEPNDVVLEVPRFKSKMGDHEIVIIKDVY